MAEDDVKTQHLIRGARHYLGEAAIDRLARDPSDNLGQARAYTARAGKEQAPSDETKERLARLAQDGRAVAGGMPRNPRENMEEPELQGQWTPTSDGLGYTRKRRHETDVVHVQYRGTAREPKWRAGTAREGQETEWLDQDFDRPEEAQEACETGRRTT